MNNQPRLILLSTQEHEMGVGAPFFLCADQPEPCFTSQWQTKELHLLLAEDGDASGNGNSKGSISAPKTPGYWSPKWATEITDADGNACAVDHTGHACVKADGSCSFVPATTCVECNPYSDNVLVSAGMCLCSYAEGSVAKSLKWRRMFYTVNPEGMMNLLS